MTRGSTPLGTHDAFRAVTSWDEATARAWADALDLRALAPDQVRLRAGVLALARVQPGDTVVEVGCGTGALLCDLAAAVGPAGRVVGIEPQPALANAATQRLARAGHAPVAEVRVGSAAQLSVESQSVAACLAQTVLIHLAPALLQEVLREMIRVVRPGGRVVSLDQDGDTWVIDHPDRELTRRIVRFNSDQRYADGWTGRNLRRLFLAEGLAGVEVTTSTHVDTDGASYLSGMARRIADAAAAVGDITPGERDGWLTQLNASTEAGRFFSSITYYGCVGTRA